MSLRQWLLNNYNKYKSIKAMEIVIEDVEFMQGVKIFVGADVEKILSDKPVKKFLDYQVVSVETNGHNTIYLGVKK